MATISSLRTTWSRGLSKSMHHLPSRRQLSLIASLKWISSRKSSRSSFLRNGPTTPSLSMAPTCAKKFKLAHSTSSSTRARLTWSRKQRKSQAKRLAKTDFGGEKIIIRIKEIILRFKEILKLSVLSLSVRLIQLLFWISTINFGTGTLEAMRQQLLLVDFDFLFVPQVFW